MPNAQVSLTLTSQVAPQIAATANAYKALSSAEQIAEAGATRYALALNKVALADAKTATEEQKLAIQTANAAKAQTQAEAAALRLANAQQKSASGSSFASQTADAFKSSILGIVGPAALAGAALASLKGLADLTVEGENVNRVARSFASLATQAHTTGDALLVAMRAASGGEVTDLNLQLAADKGLLLGVATSAAQFADIMTIARDRAAKMGTTTTQAFDDITTGIGRESPRILDNLGIIVDADAAHKAYAQSIGKTVDQLSKAERIEALRNAVIAQGKAGLDDATTAINNQTNAYVRLGVAVENAKNRLGGVLATQSQGTASSAATILSIDGTSASYAKAGIAAQNLIRSIQGVPPASAAAQKQQEGWLKAIFDFDAEARAFLGLQHVITPAVAQNTAVFDDDRQELGRLQIQAAATAAELAELAKVNNPIGLADQRKGEQTGTDLTAAQFDKFNDLAHKGDADRAAEKKKVDDKAAADAKRLGDAQDSLNLARAKTSAQKIAELKRQQAATTDPVEKLQLQASIEQERNSAAKSHTSELGKQLTLHESIFDSLNKQRDAALDIEELQITGRQQDRADQAKIKTAQAILGSSSASADFKARAQDALDLISVQERKRAQALAEKGATAGGAIIGGKVYQSAPGGGAGGGAGIGPIGPLPSAGGPAISAGGGGAVTINLVVDGKTLASVSEPYILDSILKAVRGARATAGA